MDWKRLLATLVLAATTPALALAAPEGKVVIACEGLLHI